MKTLRLLPGLIVIFISSSFTQSTWNIHNAPINENFRSVCFVDSNHGWITSDAGILIYTNDGGISWQTKVFTGVLESIHFSDQDHGCLVGWNNPPADSSFILMTADGGNIWTYAQHPNAARLYDVFFINNNIGWSVGFNEPSGWILYTDDAGMNWTKQMTLLGVAGELYGVHFRNETHGHICGVNAMFLHTNNGGTIGNGWALNISIPTLGKDLYSVYDFGETQGCAVGADGSIIYTVDNWTNWIQMISEITDTLWSVTNVEGTQHLWAVGNNGTIIHNYMYILPWEVQASNVTENLNDVCMLSETEGWAVGNNGTILHFTTAPGIDDTGDQLGTLIFPNPAKDHLLINFSKGKSFNQLMIYSQEGQCLLTMNLQRADEQIMLNLSQFSSGIYLLYLIGDLETKHQRFILQ